MRTFGSLLLFPGCVVLLVFGLAAVAFADDDPPCDQAYVHIDGNEVEFEPTGSDDTDMVQCGFDALSGLMGSKAVFGGGVFTFSETVGIKNFDGEVEGAGMGLTVVRNDPTQAFPLPPDTGTFIGMAGLFVVYQDDDQERSLEWRDMTLEFHGIPEENTAPGFEEWNRARSLIMVSGNPSALGDPNAPPTPVHTSWESVEFVGETWDSPQPPRQWGNTFSGIHLAGPLGFALPMGGNHLVRNCVFRDVLYAFNSWYHADGAILVGGSPGDWNYFERVNAGVFTHMLSNAKVEASYNVMEGVREWGVVGLTAWLRPTELSSVVASHNSIHVNPLQEVDLAPAGVALLEPTCIEEEDGCLNGVAWNNDITLEGYSTWGIIDQSHGSVIIDNVITGPALGGGIVVDGSEGCWLIRNDVGNDESSLPIILASAPNAPYPPAHGCLVVGENTASTVFDFGTDNTILDVSTIHDDELDWILDTAEEEIESLLISE